jgi:putative membrane protein
LSFNVGLALLLVSLTNTAHERFWKGRKLWGALVNRVQNLTRGIYIVVKEQSPQERVKKEATLRLVVAFAVAMKLHLRAEPLDEQIAFLMSEIQYLKLKDTQHPPLQIAFRIKHYLQHQHDRNCLNIFQTTALQKLVDDMVDILGGCERIKKTPLPLIYAIKLRQLVVIYCLILPLEIVSGLTW